MVGSLLRNTGKIIAGLQPLRNFLIHSQPGGLRIIYYHIISDLNPAYYFRNEGITISEFRKQIRFFRKYFHFISLDEALYKHGQGENLSKCITLTTDDGFIENYSIIAPILKKEKIPATFFLIDNCIDNKSLMWRNKLMYIYNNLGHQKSIQLAYKIARDHGLSLPLKKDTILSWSKRTFPMDRKEELTDLLWRKSDLIPVIDYLAQNKPYLNVNQIKELSSEGFGIGAHTKSHPLCNKLNYEDLVDEVVGSILSIRKRTGIDTGYFSYPFGVRAEANEEKRMIREHAGQFESLLGVKFKSNMNKSPYHWERDNVQVDYHSFLTRFLMVPFIRRISVINEVQH